MFQLNETTLARPFLQREHLFDRLAFEQPLRMAARADTYNRTAIGVDQGSVLRQIESQHILSDRLCVPAGLAPAPVPRRTEPAPVCHRPMSEPSAPAQDFRE